MVVNPSFFADTPDSFSKIHNTLSSWYITTCIFVDNWTIIDYFIVLSLIVCHMKIFQNMLLIFCCLFFQNPCYLSQYRNIMIFVFIFQTAFVVDEVKTIINEVWLICDNDFLVYPCPLFISHCSGQTKDYDIGVCWF